MAIQFRYKIFRISSAQPFCFIITVPLWYHVFLGLSSSCKHSFCFQQFLLWKQFYDYSGKFYFSCVFSVLQYCSFSLIIHILPLDYFITFLYFYNMGKNHMIYTVRVWVLSPVQRVPRSRSTAMCSHRVQAKDPRDTKPKDILSSWILLTHSSSWYLLLVIQVVTSTLLLPVHL